MDWFIYEFLAVVIILWTLISPILIDLVWYQWWRKYDTTGSNNCFSLAAIAYYKYNNLVYRLFNFITPPPNQFKYDWWVIFIASIMAGEAIGYVPQGICTPNTLCTTLVPTAYPISILPGLGKRWPTSVNEWIPVILAWTGMTSIPATEADWKPVPNVWQSHPDNFLANWGITAFSPAVVAFVTNWYTFQGAPLYPDILNPLLGISTSQGTMSGGWFGYLQQGDDFGGYGINEANRMLWSNIIPPPIAQGQKDASTCKTAGIVQGAAGMAMGGAFAGAQLAPEFLPESAIIGGLLGAIAGGALSAWSGGCFSKK